MKRDFLESKRTANKAAKTWERPESVSCVSATGSGEGEVVDCWSDTGISGRQEAVGYPLQNDLAA